MVFCRECQRNADLWPFYAKRGVVEAHAAIDFAAVEVVALVAEERVVLKDDEAVGEAARNVELAAILGGESGGDMFAECRRAFADIDRHIPDCPANHANELGLRVGGRLPMEAANDALGREALVILDEGVGYARLMVATGVVGFAEPAAFVAEHVGLDDLYARDFCIDDFHC